MQNLKQYIAFFGAVLSYISMLLFIDGVRKEYTDPSSVSDVLGAWFFLASTACWAIYLATYAWQMFDAKKRK